MRIYDVLNPYKLLCEEKQQLDETLSTDFTIGFELEGICTRDSTGGAYLPRYHSGNEPSGVVKELKDDLDKELGFGKGKIESDSSLSPSSDRGGWTFEYGSPIIHFNPKNIEQIYSFLKKLPSLKVYTNKSCGFHTHFSFKYIDRKNAAWIMCCMAIDNEFRKELTELSVDDKVIPFIGHYATTGLFDEIHDCLNDIYANNMDKEDAFRYYRRLNNLLTSDYEQKYRTVRVHPAGTLEWRGPRDFLNDEDIKEIHEYILKVYRIILKIAKIADSKEWKGTYITIDKKSIMDNVSVTSKFESEEEKRKISKKGSIKNKLENNSEFLLKLSPKMIQQLMASDDLDEIIGNLINYRLTDRQLALIDAAKFEVLSKRMNDSKYKDVISNSIQNASTPSDTLYSKLSESNKNRYKKLLLEDVYVTASNLNLLSYIITMKLFNIFDENILDKVFHEYNYRKKEIINNIIKISNDVEYTGVDFPVSIYKMILNSQYFYLLGNKEHISPKIQRMMVRKSPYMVQYIQHLDPEILKFLKEKNPDIENYVIGEF